MFLILIFFKLSTIIIATATILAVNCYIIVVLICSFLLISNIGHFFTYLLAIMCLKSVAHIWTGLHYPYWVWGVPYTFLKQTFSWHMISKYFVALYKFLFIMSWGHISKQNKAPALRKFGRVVQLHLWRGEKVSAAGREGDLRTGIGRWICAERYFPWGIRTSLTGNRVWGKWGHRNVLGEEETRPCTSMWRR